jgi:hypothetical protein
VTTDAPTAAERDAMAETIGMIEGRYAWDHIDPELQRLFASRLSDALPGFDPASRWESMTVGHRREWIHHARQTDEQFRAVWVADEEHLRAQADDATVEAFRSLVSQEGDR